MTFKYLAKTNFKLQQDLVDEVIALGAPAIPPRQQKSNRIYLQIMHMVVTGQTLTEPIELTSPNPAPNDRAILTPEILEEFKQRFANLKETGFVYPEEPPAGKAPVSPELNARINASLPKVLGDLNPITYTSTYHITTTGGDWHHCDIFKPASLFYLIEGGGEETAWYEPTDDLVDYPFFRFGDPKKLTKVHSEVIQPGIWYIFDHFKYHNVTAFKTGVRNRFNIEFDGLTAAELYEIVSSL